MDKAYQQPTAFILMGISCILEPADKKGGLYLSNQRNACDVDGLLARGITAVISVVDKPVKRELYEHLSIVHYSIEAQDEEKEDLFSHFSPTCDFIKEHLGKGNVLVHCLAGVSRSPTIVMAFLMKNQGMSFENALNLVKEKRPLVGPNEGFKKQLREWEAFLSDKK